LEVGGDSTSILACFQDFLKVQDYLETSDISKLLNLHLVEILETFLHFEDASGISK